MHRTTSTPKTVEMLKMLPLLIVLAMLLAACGDTSGTETSGQGTAPQGGTPTQAADGSNNSTDSGGASQQATATAPSARVTAPPEDNSRRDWSGVDVCKLLTKQELESVVGPIGDDAAPVPDEYLAIDGETSCRFYDPNKSYRALLVVGPPKLWDFEHDSAVSDGRDPQAFSGIGDDAFITPDHTLVARWQGKGVTIRLSLSLFSFETGSEMPFVPEQARQLAQTAYERLP